MERKGFSLIELMITMAVAAILAAVAYPSYQSFVVKSRRGEAQAVLMDISQRQKQFLLDKRRYATTLAELNYAVPASVSMYYSIPDPVTTVAPPPPTFTVTATPKSGTPQDGDVTLTINHEGVKTPAGKW